MVPSEANSGKLLRSAERGKAAKTSKKELVILTGISGAGKASALKTFEDLGYQAVDNLPLELMPEFAGLVEKSKDIERAAIVVDVREGQALDRLPEIIKQVKRVLPTRVVFLDAQDPVLVRRYSETRRPHPLRRSETVSRSIVEERQMLDSIRNVADTLIDTSRFNVHELRAEIQKRFGRGDQSQTMLVSCLSFGFKNGVPLDADLVFDVRFLPNPHFVPEFHDKTGLDPKVAAYVAGFPQTGEFLDKVTDMMLYLMPHYVKEGKSYLTVAFGCTGGQHRSVMMAEEMTRRLTKAGYQVKAVHRDMPR
jgi:RNase adapter protein RapZ